MTVMDFGFSISESGLCDFVADCASTYGFPLMSLWTCPFCGQEFEPAKLNLLRLFEHYLLIVFLLSLAVRYQQYRSYLGFLWAVPEKWPSMYALIRKHTRVLLTWTMLIPAGIAFAIYAVHYVSLRWVWRESNVDLAQLSGHWEAALPLLLLGMAMLAFDLRSLLATSRVEFAEIEANLNKGEFALTSRTAKLVRFLSFRRLDASRIVEDRIADTMLSLRLVFLRQLRQQSFHTILRMAFGCLLWASWARVVLSLPSGYYVLALASIGLLVGVAWRWTGETLPANVAPAEEP